MMKKILTAFIVIMSLSGIAFVLIFGKHLSQRPSLASAYQDATRLASAANTNGFLIKQTAIETFTIFDDHIYVLSTNLLGIYNLSGQLERKISLDMPAYCLAIANATNIYLGFNNQLYNYDGKKVKKWKELADNVMIVAIGVIQGQVYVTDSSNLKVWQVSSENTRPLAGPRFIVPSPYFDLKINEFLWVVNPGKHRLVQYDLAGNFITNWGKSGSDDDQFCGCCNPSFIELLSDGSIITSEKGLRRVKKYSNKGEYLGIIADFSNSSGRPFFLAVDSADNIYLLNNDLILKYLPTL